MQERTIEIQKSKIKNDFASVPQQLQGLFRKEEIVGASPTGGPIFDF